MARKLHPAAVYLTRPANEPWAYHVTAADLLPAIQLEGLRPFPHEHLAPGDAAIFVERDFDGASAYHHPPDTVVLRFRTPGFASTDDGEDVLYGGSGAAGELPPPPLVGPPGTQGAVPAHAVEMWTGTGWTPIVGQRTSRAVFDEILRPGKMPKG